MGQDAERYSRSIALAGWMWWRLRSGGRYFRREELSDVDQLREMGGNDAAAAKLFERTRAELAEFGISVTWREAHEYTSPDGTVHGGCYEINPARLSDREQRALLNIAFTVAFDDWDARRHGMVPGALLEDPGDTVLLASGPLVDDIADALVHRRLIRFGYKDRVRRVQPMRLVVAKGAWYLIGLDREIEALRTFKLSRIRDLETVDGDWDDRLEAGEVERQEETLAHPERFPSARPLRIRVAVEPYVPVRRYLPDPVEVGELDDGRGVYEFESGVEFAIDRLANLHARAEILSPDAAREAMVEHLRGMAEAGS